MKVANAEPARRERSVHLDKRRKSVPQGEPTCGGGFSQARDEGSKQVQRSAVGVATSDDTRRRRRSLGCRRDMGALRTQRSAVRGRAVESGAFALRGKSSTKVMAQPAAEWRVAV